MHILVTRPMQDAQGLEDLLAQEGHRAVIDPMLIIDYHDVSIALKKHMETHQTDAIIMTSQRALESVLSISNDALLEELKNFPLYCVGKETVEKCKAAGFGELSNWAETSKELCEKIKAENTENKHNFLYLAGTHRKRDLEYGLRNQGIALDLIEVYTAHPCKSLHPHVIRALKEGRLDGAMFYSQRSADIFIKKCRERNLLEKAVGLDCFCLSQMIAGILSDAGFTKIHVAANPDQPSLVECLRGHFSKKT